ncbi:glucose-1-phosphate cytidylyltransferase [Salegentibacter salinarum]|uniref:Glucose-1-phosphate cytidylyltransferase n=1 Tax=Salegentibacter salinarum TaxID=447422 RepID=A0A2N0TNF2_9FLAO|nr:glucose-1-phosphate cytidylyltransferase [Salegentibacter salinarum]PKD16250.1 glucose-1-phosphate cytidylyltransferase [Salegentibacter salinarum]SKB67436.1 glucose-1-phosphate cytidylyltransferase [Salegentibacter salinarum]
MKVVLLAGGFGTRLSEETDLKPKPMVEIGGKPILWHIMKIYSHYGFNEFVICLGYKGYVIKEYFFNYFRHLSDISINLGTNTVEILNTTCEPWKISLIETGLHTMTGGRIKRIKPFVNNEPFLLTYGDGVGSVNIKELIDFHKSKNKLISVTAVQPSGRFGAMSITDGNDVDSFLEKPRGDGGWINGGFFVCQPEVFDYIKNDHTVFEKEPLESLAKEGEMAAYKHMGFWKPMDSLRDKRELETLWSEEKAPWKVW